MAKIFLSHSSKDKSKAKKIAMDLMKYGHDVWLDEWEIRVGDCIITGIEGGIESADQVVILLSPHSVASSWVDKEWKAKYWTEINQENVTILPILLDDCKIPILLKSKKYADFRTEYNIGFRELLQALNPQDKDRLVFKDRVIDVRNRLNKLISGRVEIESKELFGKVLSYENHRERFAEITHFAQETERIYTNEIASDIDEIINLLPNFNLSDRDLSQHRKLTINTMGWRKVLDHLNDVISRLEQPS